MRRVEDVAGDEDAVGLAPEGDVAGGVAGDVEDLEAGDLVALAQLAVYGVAGTGAGAEEELGERVVGLALADQLRVLGGVGVGLADPERDRELGADPVADALVVGVGVGERVGRDLVALQLLEDAAARRSAWRRRRARPRAGRC